MAILLLMIFGLAVLSLLAKVYCDARPKAESCHEQCGGSRSCSVIQVSLIQGCPAATLLKLLYCMVVCDLGCFLAPHTGT